MEDVRWNQLVTDIEGDDIERMVEASEHLQKEAEASDVARLLGLLEHKNFVVREAAAWPLAIVGGASVLPELLIAFQLGFDEGYDNDGFEAALIALVELHPNHSREKLLELQNEPNPIFHKYANWLLDFC